MINNREYPKNLSAEQAVLGCVMLEPTCLDEIALILTPDHFYRDAHQRLYQILLERHRAGQDNSYPEVHLFLEDKGLAETVATIDELRACCDRVPNTTRHAEYAAKVLSLAKRRQLIQVLREAENDLFDLELDPDDIASATSRHAETIRIEGAKLRGRHISDVVSDAVEAMWQTRDGQLPGLPSPWPELDRLTGGFGGGRLIVLAGRTGMGKTAAALNIVRSVAGSGFGVYVASMEMGESELANRKLASETGLPSTQLKYKAHTLLPHQRQTVEKARAELSKLNIWIDDSGKKTIFDLVDESRAYVRKHDVGMIVVDYLGLITETRPQQKLTRQQFLGVCTRQLKLLAKDLNVPVLLLAQLNRDVEKREDKRPQLSDLRECGDTEQDADQVLMIYRDGKDPSDNRAELMVRKNRHGGTGVVYLEYDGPTTTFKTLTINNGSHRAVVAAF